MGKISDVENAIISKLASCGVSLVENIKDKTYGYFPELRILPAISISTVSGKFNRIAEDILSLDIFPTISIVSENLRSAKDRQLQNSEFIEAIAGVLSEKTFNDICEPVQILEFEDEYDPKNLESGIIFYRLKLKTTIYIDILQDEDQSELLTSIVNSYKSIVDNKILITGTTNLT